MLNNNDDMMPVAQNSPANYDSLIHILKRLGIEFYIDKNGSLQSKRSKIINPEKILTDPELMLHYKGGFFISDPTETYWIYIRIFNGKIKELFL